MPPVAFASRCRPSFDFFEKPSRASTCGPDAADVDGIENDVAALRDVRHPVDQRDAGRRAVAVVVVDPPDLARLDCRGLILLVLSNPGVASLNDPRIETLGEQHEMLLPAHRAHDLRQAGEQVDLALHIAAVVLVLLRILAEDYVGMVVTLSRARTYCPGGPCFLPAAPVPPRIGSFILSTI